MIILKATEKVLGKNLTSITDKKIPSIIAIKANFPPDKGHWHTQTPSKVTINHERPEVSAAGLRPKWGWVSAVLTAVQRCAGGSGQFSETRKINSCSAYKTRLSLFIDNIIISVGKPTESGKKVTRTNQWIWQGSQYTKGN